MRVLVIFVFALLAPATSQAAGPACALLDPEKSPRVALLEAKLLADPSATWVERDDIDKVLKEQKLQAMFGPQGLGERVKLGKLLKADVLVLVRPAKDAKEPMLEVVVSESAGGLRLLVRAIAVTKDVDADVAALLAAARDGIKKHGEKITDVVAVPPFVSNDLEMKQDYLKGAFAKLAEVEALDRKGVVVVELAEAEAMAKELALAAPGLKLHRPLPVYLLGEYRHEGKDKDRTISLKFRAERGGKPVVKSSVEVLRPEVAPNTIRMWAAAVLDVLAKDDKPRPPADPKTEAKQLAERAAVFKRLGNWSEALSLLEASFLVDPDQLELHVTAITVISPQVRSQWSGATHGKIELEPVVQLYSRGLGHLEAYVAGGGDLAKHWDSARGDFMMDFYISANGLMPPGPGTPASKQRLAILQTEAREVYLRMIPILAKRGKNEERLFINRAIQHLPPTEKYALLGTIIVQLQELPQARSRTVAYVHQGFAYLSGLEGLEFQTLLERLEASKNADLRAAAVDLRKKLEIDRKLKPPAFTTDRNKPTVDPKLVRLEPVQLVSSDKDAGKYKGLLACGPSLDVLWTDFAVFLMKEKGKVALAWRPADRNYRITTVCFDGRFIWVATSHHKSAPMLVAIDPVSGKVRQVVEADGLPQPEGAGTTAFSLPILMVTALAPGQVGVVGSHGRSWAAVVSFDPGKDKVDVKVILKANEAQDRSDRTQWSKPEVAFRPNYLFTLTGPVGADGKSERRMLIGRGNGTNGTENTDLARRPLVLDPHRGTAEAIKDEFRNWPDQNNFGVAGGAVYSTEFLSGTSYRLFRVAFPATAKETIATGLPNDIKLIVVHQGRIHFTTAHLEKDPTISPDPKATVNPQWKTICRWWTVDADGKNLRLSADNMPVMQALAISSHYGLVALVGGRDAGALHTVEVADLPSKK